MKFYPLADWPTLTEMRKLGFTPAELSGVRQRHDIRAVLTGQRGHPRSGEWYLSGAIPEAYRAPNALTTDYHLLRLVRVKERTVTTIISDPFK